jgi:hypothetical protein
MTDPIKSGLDFLFGAMTVMDNTRQEKAKTYAEQLLASIARMEAETGMRWDGQKFTEVSKND